MQDSTEIYRILEHARKELGLSQADVSERAFGRRDNSALQNIRRGALPSVEKLAALSRVLKLDFHFGPQEQKRPKLDFSTDAELPHRGIAKCSIQGWGKEQPDREPLPRPEFINDPDAFWVSATGQSMIPEGIDSGSYCLVSPAQDIREGDRIWIKDSGGATSIKRLIRMTRKSLVLRGWLPIKDGKQESFDEERFSNNISQAYPVVAVFKGKPGNDGTTYIPDPIQNDPQSVIRDPDGEYQLIPLHDVQAAAGISRTNVQEDAMSGIAFPTRWLRDHGVQAERASLIYISGDSMAPTLEDGSTILINHARTAPRGRRIYAFRIGDDLRVKRLELIGEGQLLILSDNPAHTSELLTISEADDIEVIGEVVWASRFLRGMDL